MNRLLLDRQDLYLHSVDLIDQIHLCERYYAVSSAADLPLNQIPF